MATMTITKAELKLNKVGEIVLIPLDQIKPDPRQPRKSFDEYELGALAESIRRVGQLQPAQVIWSESEGCYLLVFGERRWRACQIAGRQGLTCQIVTRLDRDHIEIRQLIENMQRAAVPPMQEAMAFAEYLMRTGRKASELATELGVTSSRISKAIALTKLEPEVQLMIEDGSLSGACGYELSRVRKPSDQLWAAEHGIEQGWSRNQFAKEVSAILDGRIEERKEPEKVMGLIDLPVPENGEERESIETEAVFPPFKVVPPKATAGFEPKPEPVAETAPDFPREKKEAPMLDRGWKPEHHFRFEPFRGCYVDLVFPGSTESLDDAFAHAVEYVANTYRDRLTMRDADEKGRGLPPGQ